MKRVKEMDGRADAPAWQAAGKLWEEARRAAMWQAPGRAIGGGQVDTRAAAGRLMLNVFAAFAQFELKIMKERQREGIADAKAAGKYKGRRPTARAKPQMWSGCLKAANECPRSRGRSISDGPVSTGRLRMLN